jgi:hypothetical protein
VTCISRNSHQSVAENVQLVWLDWASTTRYSAKLVVGSWGIFLEAVLMLVAWLGQWVQPYSAPVLGILSDPMRCTSVGCCVGAASMLFVSILAANVWAVFKGSL